VGMRYSLFVCLVFLFVVSYSDAKIGCLNGSGAPVDWWVIVKFPYNANTSNPFYATGYAYAYADKSSSKLSIMTNSRVSDASGALGRTINQIYGASSTVGWLMYDDQPPTGTASTSYGHTKGDIAFDSTSGFWLVHSVPQYPNATGPFSFPQSGSITYGQSFLCVSYATSTFNSIGGQLLINKPFVYASNIPSSFSSLLPNLFLVLQKKWITTSSTALVKLYSYPSKQLFYCFAKNTAWNSELYEYLVQPYFKKAGYWETWMNGVNPLPSYCPPDYPYASMNVRSVSIEGQVSWTETKDHSKWGVLVDMNVVCIGDINRQASQAGRGGGTVCIDNESLYDSFWNAIQTADQC